MQAAGAFVEASASRLCHSFRDETAADKGRADAGEVRRRADARRGRPVGQAPLAIWSGETSLRAREQMIVCISDLYLVGRECRPRDGRAMEEVSSRRVDGSEGGLDLPFPSPRRLDDGRVAERDVIVTGPSHTERDKDREGSRGRRMGREIEVQSLIVVDVTEETWTRNR